jgi:arginine repressor
VRVRLAPWASWPWPPPAGAAKAVAAALKAANWPEVKGILAEDETLFITDNVYDSRLLLQRMQRIIGK